jgi:hypothetical protein
LIQIPTKSILLNRRNDAKKPRVFEKIVEHYLVVYSQFHFCFHFSLLKNNIKYQFFFGSLHCNLCGITFFIFT